MSKKAAEQTQVVSIKPPNIQTLAINIEGVSPLVINRFSQKAALEMEEKQKAGSTAKGKKERASKDFDALYEGAKHVSEDGWCGMAASAFRNAMISACRLANFKMTLAKLSVFVVPDGFDVVDGIPLVKITKGKPEKYVAHTRNATGVIDLRSRPMWREWGATVKVQFDADMFTANDVVNLMARVGAQVGIGEGRPDSKQSAGMGFGLFRIVS